MAKILERYVTLINGLHSVWMPHDGQVRVGKALFGEESKDIFVQAGRNWGKTEFVSYALWRYAQAHPGSENYYFSPFQKQSREILWASQRLQNFGPKEWIDGKPNEVEMRIRFANGSFIKVDGSDNVESYRGVKPRGVSVFDEFKDFRPEFFDAYDPNRAAFNSPLLIIGTPPERECQFLTVAENFKRDPSKKFFKAPSHENPHISREWLEKKRAELVARGEEDVWQREYLAEYVPGGVAKVLPMFTRAVVQDHAALIKSLERDLRKLDFYLITDPAAATTFGVLFIAMNPVTKHIYVLDEIYEQEQSEMSVGKIGPRLQAGKREFDRGYGMEWMQVYDEAEKWFQSEMLDHFQESFLPTQKGKFAKEWGLGLIKDILLASKLTMSSRCVKLFWEMDNYYKDKNGKIPKVNDHLIDCFRYFLGASHYSLTPIESVVLEDVEKPRGYRIEDDLMRDRDPGDFDIGGDYL